MSAIPLTFYGKLENANIKLVDPCFSPCSGNACRIHEQQRPLHLKTPPVIKPRRSYVLEEPLISITAFFQLLVGIAGQRGRGEII